MSAKPFTVKAAAKHLGISEKKVREHLREGRLMRVPGVGPVRIDPHSVKSMKQQGDKPEHPTSRDWKA